MSTPQIHDTVTVKIRRSSSGKERVSRFCYICKTTFFIEKDPDPPVEVENEDENQPTPLHRLIPIAKSGLEHLCSYYKLKYEDVLKKPLEENQPEGRNLPIDQAFCLPCLRHLAHLERLTEDIQILTRTRSRKFEGLGYLLTDARKRRRDPNFNPVKIKRQKVDDEGASDSDGDSLYGETNPWAQFRKGIARNYIEMFGAPVRTPVNPSDHDVEFTSSEEEDEVVEDEENEVVEDVENEEAEETVEAEEGVDDSESDSEPEVKIDNHKDEEDDSVHSSATSTEIFCEEDDQAEPKQVQRINNVEHSGYTSDSDNSITDHILDLELIKPTHLAKAKELRQHFEEIDNRLVCDICGISINLKKIPSRENAELKMLMHVFNQHFPQYHTL